MHPDPRLLKGLCFQYDPNVQQLGNREANLGTIQWMGYQVVTEQDICQDYVYKNFSR